jgi:hypothetical protein
MRRSSLAFVVLLFLADLLPENSGTEVELPAKEARADCH